MPRSSPTRASILRCHPAHGKVIDDLTAAIGEGRSADGFVAAIAAIGGHLARHFPPAARDPNELPDHLIILQ